MIARERALAQIASWIARGVDTGEIEFVTGTPRSLMAPGDWDTYAWAVMEVRRRLFAIGDPEPRDSDAPVIPMMRDGNTRGESWSTTRGN
jgi:hypothetical protein